MASLEIPGPLGRPPSHLLASWRRRYAIIWILAEEAIRRFIDFSMALAALILSSPLLVLRGSYAKLKTGRVFDQSQVVGRFRVPFSRLRFAGQAPGRGLAVLINVIKGEMSFAGPRALTIEAAAAVPMLGLERFWIRPGIVSAYWLRRGIGVAYEDEYQLDREFYYGQSLSGDLGLMARAIPGSLLHASAPGNTPSTLTFFGVEIANVTMDEAVEWILDQAKAGTISQLCFVNPDCLNIAYTNSDYRSVLTKATRVLPDGIGIHLAGRMKHTPMLENVNGTDLFPRLCAQAAAERVPLYLLGARPSVAAAVAQAMTARYPGLQIAGTRNGYFEPEETASVVREINASGAKILAVAMGAPKQELWLAANRAQLQTPVLIGVGGLFDFYSGNMPRAPIWMREIGLEWVWRLLREPARMWRRYLVGNPLFLYRVWKEVRQTA